LQELGWVSFQDRMWFRFQDFALKIEFDPRFQKYFRLSPSGGRSLRHQRDYVIPIASTERRLKSPFVAMAQYFNALPTSRDQRLQAHLQTQEPRNSNG